MSHFTRVRTRMVERESLIRALEDLDYTCEEGKLWIRGFGGQRTRVEIKVPSGSRGYDIGLLKKDDAYEVVADWWGIKGVTQKRFLRELTQRYAYHAARAKLEEQGFALVSEEKQVGGRIHLVLRRMT